MEHQLSPDQKGLASEVFGKLRLETQNNFPDPRFRPIIIPNPPYYHFEYLDTSPFSICFGADGIGTKPELAERLAENFGDPSFFESLAFDAFAMVESDQARFGRFTLGIVQQKNFNKINPGVINAIAMGIKAACGKGQFALLDGETAEEGYRISGYGNNRVNWSALAVGLRVPDKEILGVDLRPSQPIVAIAEPESPRCNGYTLIRDVLEACWLYENNYPDKLTYVSENLNTILEDELYNSGFRNFDLNIDPQSLIFKLNNLMGHNFLEQVLVPWHHTYPDLTKELLKPSTLYGPLMYKLQGGIDGETKVDMVAAAHISGGGVPEKTMRMLSKYKLGVHLDRVFPDPKCITDLIGLALELPYETRSRITDQIFCENLGRGYGFLIVARTKEDARDLVEIANSLGYQAAIAGKILDEPKIEFRGHTWTY